MAPKTSDARFPKEEDWAPWAQSFAFAIVNLHEWSQAINAPTLVLLPERAEPPPLEFLWSVHPSPYHVTLRQKILPPLFCNANMMIF